MRDGQRKNSSIDFEPGVCILNGEPIPVNMPANVSPPGPMKGKKSAAAKLKSEKIDKVAASAELEKDCLALAAVVTERLRKEKKHIKEV